MSIMTTTESKPAKRDIALPSAADRELALLQNAARDLEKCQSINEAKHLKVKAESLRAIQKKIGLSRRAQNASAEISLHAQKRMGELLEPKTGRPGKMSTEMTLSELGITRNESSAAQAIAAIPADEFNAVIQAHIESNRELTTKGMAKLGRQHKRKMQRQEAKQTAVASNPLGASIHTGDLSLLDDLVADDSVDLFFTDPPYDEESTPLFGRLAELAQRKLKPGGLCLTYTGSAYMDSAIVEMRNHLDWYLMLGVRLTGPNNKLWTRNAWNLWRPVLVFCKRPRPAKPSHDWIQDFRVGVGPDKGFHDWGLNPLDITYWIEQLTMPGALVVDPFCGGGSIPVACKLTGRRWIATEIDPESAAIARRRVSEINATKSA